MIIIGVGTYLAAKVIWEASEKDAVVWGAAAAGAAWASTRLPSVNDLLQGPAPQAALPPGPQAIILHDPATEAAYSTNAPN